MKTTPVVDKRTSSAYKPARIVFRVTKWLLWRRMGRQRQDGNLGNAASVAGDPGPEVGALLGDGAGDGGALHFTLVVDYHSRVVLRHS